MTKQSHGNVPTRLLRYARNDVAWLSAFYFELFYSINKDRVNQSWQPVRSDAYSITLHATSLQTVYHISVEKFAPISLYRNMLDV